MAFACYPLKTNMGQVYIIHFDEKLAHARHYVGFVLSDSPNAVNKRYEQHVAGRGANLLKVANDRGIRFKVVRVIVNQTRANERKIKNRKKTSQLCPVCQLESKQGKQLPLPLSYPRLKKRPVYALSA